MELFRYTNMLILIFLQLSHSKLCADYSCSIVPLNFASQCIEKVGYTYTLGTCNEEYYSYCPPSYTDSFCQLPPVPSDINIAVPGEPCEFDRNCLNSICQQSFCKGYPMGLMCNQDTQCDVGLYCDSINNYCTAQVSAGNACSRDEECTNSCGCFNGNCKNYFTLVSGTVLETCINGRNLLCLSGACQSYLNVNYCVKQETSLGVLPILCANDGDCEVSSNFTYSTGCACGYNEFGYSYCNLAPGDSLFLNYTLALQEWVSSSNISLCHTTARMDLQCIGAHWNYTNYINLAFYQSAVMNYPLVQGNDICIQEIYTNSYWEIKEIFDEINEPSPVNDFAFYFIGTSLVIELI